ncbi:prenyl cysteine carboxyl methyltransferase Ste14 [Paecilomyces variotii No. 5]|uniref:Protein-S-isoprenylcysteine O-methyltransferase n=1 Tax=Byssochlamys spectabilis (strain No. 5 / NBRC 109023) TaxID=1356009 RepID=V5GF84_BYSSN|nr:prenyl cysteine carboxyl methyltransferase Ste14 [Paecilomyces variotii No. 5]
MSNTATSSGSDTNTGNSNISWPMERADERTEWPPVRPVGNGSAKPPLTLDPSNYPGGKKALSGISLRAFCLGTGFGVSTCLTLFLFLSTPLWRAPFFIASLCLFHFLEYYVTAQYNTRHASISAFLLSANGWAYNVAHSSAVAECILSRLFLPASYFQKTTISFWGINLQVLVGLALMIVGQVFRTLAMAQAGSNFNHTVQVERKEGHTLVKSGVYRVFRHPSYFGFFWWGLGSQLVLGNMFCLLTYALVLWKFFSARIQREEAYLIHFFGEEYLLYKKRTGVGIPGIY